MATIRTAIQIQDSMTPAMRSMTNALNICINSFEAMQNVSGNAVDTASISAARAELARVETAMNEVEEDIRAADNAQRQLNGDMRSASSVAEGFASKIKTVVGAIATMAGVKKAIDLSDTLAQTTARLDLMNDKQQTTADLQEKIFASAERARGAYQTTADAVSKLGMQAGKAFSSNDEIIAFTEQLNKTFVIAGASAVGVDSVMLQLTQSMAAGKLQGEELNAVLDNAQPIVANIQNYLQNVRGMPQSVTDNIKQLASDGIITADIIKNAMFYAANETDKKFATMPRTFSQVWTSIQNHALRAFQPVLKMINTVANSKGFTSMVNASISALSTLATVAAKVFNEVVYISGVIIDNWSLIAPVVWSVVAAYAAYNAHVLISAVRTAYDTIVKYAHAAASWAETAAIIALEAAQFGLNAAIAMCPISWIIMAIIALIAIFYLAIAAVNKFAGTSLSATGIIVGAFFWLGGMIYNVIALAWNTILSFAEFLGNVFKNPTAAIYNLFATIWNGIVEIVGRSVNEIIGLINKIPGMELGFVNWGKGLTAKKDILNGVDLSRYQLDYSSGNFMTGYNLGNEVANKFDLNSLGSMNPGQGLGLDLSKLGNDMADTAANTGKMKDSLDITKEDLKYLRDIAEQEVINRFTTAEIKIDMGGVHNNVSSDMDIDGMVTYLKDTLIETVQTAAEKVHK